MSQAVEHRRHKGLNNRAANAHQPTRERERRMRRFKDPGHAQRFLAAYGEAHPRRLVGLAGGPRHRTIHLTVPDLGDDIRNRDFQQAIQDFATSLAKLVRAGPGGRSKEEKPS